jgi:hypothetical protein
MGRLTPTTTTYRNPRSGSEFALGAPCMSTPTRGAEDLCTQSNTVGRSGGKPRDKLGNGADSDDVFVPATPTAQATTISHDSPTIFSPAIQCRTSSDCRSVLEGVMQRGWCASKLGLGPEYPGLDESEEYASWSILHWCSRLVQ